MNGFNKARVPYLPVVNVALLRFNDGPKLGKALNDHGHECRVVSVLFLFLKG